MIMRIMMMNFPEIQPLVTKQAKKKSVSYGREQSKYRYQVIHTCTAVPVPKGTVYGHGAVAWEGLPSGLPSCLYHGRTAEGILAGKIREGG